MHSIKILTNVRYTPCTIKRIPDIFTYNSSIVIVIGLVCCAYSLYPGICSVLFSLGITSFSANHRARISQYK